MDIQRLIAIAGRKRQFPARRVTYAQVIADCPVSETEMLDALLRIRSPDASAPDVRATLRRLMRALPRAGLDRRRHAWNDSPGSVWREALRFERQSRIARLTEAETADAVLRVMAGGGHEAWLWNRIGWAFTQGGLIPRRVPFGQEDDPDEVAGHLFRLDRLYLARLEAPEMGAEELTELVLRLRAGFVEGPREWHDEDLLTELERQLPNSDVGWMITRTHRTAGAEALVREALAQTQPDPNLTIIYD